MAQEKAGSGEADAAAGQLDEPVQWDQYCEHLSTHICTKWMACLPKCDSSVICKPKGVSRDVSQCCMKRGLPCNCYILGSDCDNDNECGWPYLMCSQFCEQCPTGWMIP